jgi:hypothetical protein
VKVIVHQPKGEEAQRRKIQIVSIDGKPCYRIWPWGRGEGWRWARNLDYWPDDGLSHDAAHGKQYSKHDAIAACIEHYAERRVRAEAREPREEKDIE